MSLVRFWLAIAGVFLVVEMATLTLDFLALSIAALGVALTAYLLGWWGEYKYISLIVFGGYAVVSVLIFRIFIKKWIFGPKPLGESPLSIDRVKGQKLIVQDVDGKLVVWYEGNYRNIVSDEQLKPGDTVIVEDFKDGKLVVKKVL